MCQKYLISPNHILEASVSLKRAHYNFLAIGATSFVARYESVENYLNLKPQIAVKIQATHCVISISWPMYVYNIPTLDMPYYASKYLREGCVTILIVQPPICRNSLDF